MTRTIKKYKNRRLYDMHLSQYVTIDDLQGYITQGIPFEVEDSVTHKNITSTTLLQILIEIESGATQLLSKDMLRQLILLAHHPLSQSFKEPLAQVFSMIEAYMKTAPYQSLPSLWQTQLQQMTMNWHNYFKSK